MSDEQSGTSARKDVDAGTTEQPAVGSPGVGPGLTGGVNMTTVGSDAPQAGDDEEQRESD
jgi:hypothetical protein